MGKTLYLIKQTVPDTATDASTNADEILNIVLDAMKDLSNSPVANLLTDNPDLSGTHSVTLYEDSAKNTQLLKNSNIFVDMFDQQYAVLVSEYQKQTTWDGNDASYSDGTVTHTTNVGYNPSSAKNYVATTSIDPASAALYDATLFITTDEVNIADTSDNRFRVTFDPTGDASGRYQVFKAINSSTYRTDGTSGLTVEEVEFNQYAGLTETYIVRDPSTNALSLDEDSNSGHKLTDASFTLTYSYDADVSYGSFKVSQEPIAAGINARQNETDVSANQLYIRDANGFSFLPDTIESDDIPELFGIPSQIGASYTLTITNNGGGGYSFSTGTYVTSDNNITISDDALVNNDEYMKLVTSYPDDTNTGKGTFERQYLLWTNGSVEVDDSSYASSITIGTEAETLNQTESATNGIVTYFASDLTYSSTSTEPQRSAPDNNWNGSDLLSVDYTTLASYYKQYQVHELETRVLLPSTHTDVLNADPANNTYAIQLGTSSSGRYITASDNMVFFKSDINNTNIDPTNITVTTNGIYDASNIDSNFATIFEIGSNKAFTNQSSLLEAEVLDGSYVAVPGSIVSIVATSVIVPNATDYRFKMNPKQIDGNSDDSYDFPTFNNGFTFVALDSSNQTYAATNYLETLKSNMNILGNNIYSIMENNADVNLNIVYETNGTALNADSLKNYFDISYSFTVGGVDTTGTHRIEDLDRMTLFDVTSSPAVDVSYGILTSNDICGNPVTSMLGWQIHQIEEETTFKVRTQLYLGAYSNLYIETPLLKQTDTRYELRTAAGVAKPDYYLKYVNPLSYNVTAHRGLKINQSSAPILVNTVSLSVNDLKSHIGDIQYTEGIADNDDDVNWETVAGPQDVDPNFDSANIFAGSGNYNVYIDVPKTYLLDAPQYIIRMQADPTSTTIVGYKYAANDTLFTYDSYDWDMTIDSLTNGQGISFSSELTVTYETAENNDVTIAVFQNGTELFHLVHNGDIVQKIRVIYNPRGIAETMSWISESLDDTWTYFGTVATNTILYQPADGLTFQLDERFRDGSASSSYWELTQDVANLQRVVGSLSFNDLSGQTIDQDGEHSLTYSGNGARSVTFTYYRGNADGLLSTIDIIRVQSTLNYRIQTTQQTSINGSYDAVWVGFSATTTPTLLHSNYGVTDFGLHIDDIDYSILAGTNLTTEYDIYMTFDTYNIDEANTEDYHNGTTIASAGDYLLFEFDGANPVISGIVAGTIKSPVTDYYEITRGTTEVFIYYSPVFIGDVETFPDASWSLLTQGIVDASRNSPLIHTIEDPISYVDMNNGIYFNNTAIFIQRLTSNAPSFIGYFVCPPPQLKVTGVVITNSGPKPHYAGTSSDDKPTIFRYNPLSTNSHETQSYYIDVDQVALHTTYHPFENYVSDNSYYMNDLALYENASQKSIKSYRDSQTYSRQVDIKENKFSIYEYSGLLMADTVDTSPYDEVEPNNFKLLDSNYLSTLSSTYGSVSMSTDASYASYTIGIKQNKYPLTQVVGSRYGYENMTFTIGSPFLLETDLNYYAGSGGFGTYEDDWVPIETTGPYVLPLDFNVGNATRLSLYGTNFTYSQGTITLSLKKYSTNYGIDYSNFPRELTSVYLYAKNKQYKQISFTRPELTTANEDESLTAEDNNAELIRQQLALQSWTSKSYTTENNFTSGSLRFELVPAISYVYNTDDLDVSANLINAGAREILSILAVTEDEPRNILFMNLEDNSRPYDGSAYGKYLPSSLQNYSGQSYSVTQTSPGDNDSKYVIPMKEKFGVNTSIYTTYGY